MLFNIYSHLLAFTRIYSHSKLIITARTKFPRGFLHIELKVILDLDTIVCLIRTLLYGENEIHAIQCQEYYKANHAWPEKILVFRDGVGDSQLTVIAK